MKIKRNIVIVGTVRNVGNTLNKNFYNIEKSLKGIPKTWYLIESDSSDKTLQILEKLKKNNTNFNYLSLGNLTNNYKNKLVRLAYCRNKYLEFVKKNKFEYMIVADLDLNFNSLHEKELLKCFKRKDWTVCSANCNGPYYDIGALRHEIWSPNDATQQWKFYNNFSKDYVSNSIRSIQSRMITIEKTKPWIRVESAFNGMAIYRVKNLNGCKYKGVYKNQKICEHVPFHNSIVKKKKKIFINPKLIFSKDKFNEHTVRITKRRRLLSYLKMFVKTN